MTYSPRHGRALVPAIHVFLHKSEARRGCPRRCAGITSRESGVLKQSALFVIVGAALEPLKRALNASTAPLLESLCGRALDLLRRPVLPRTEIGNAPWEQYGKRLGQGHGIGLIARFRSPLAAAQAHDEPNGALAEETARSGVIEQRAFPDPGLGIVDDSKIAALDAALGKRRRHFGIGIFGNIPLLGIAVRHHDARKLQRIEVALLIAATRLRVEHQTGR